MKKRLFLFLVLFLSFHLGAFAVNPPIVEITLGNGKVEGTNENGIGVFKGIPFAAPPVGDLRWKEPQPVKNWDGILKADHFAPACPQRSFEFPGAPKLETSEDCLYLNVWTPATSSEEKLPVMVWIYGGGFSMGTTSFPSYSGEKLAKMGVVLVSIAYRVGPLGFLSLPELTAESPHHVSGNYGLLDQIAGLKWVQKNIAAFGGDPNRVTIFGESAGGISVSMLAASPLTKGLFRGAISESGGSFGPVGSTREVGGIQRMNDAEKNGEAFAKRMGANSLAELRKVDPEKWMQDPASQMGGFWPVVDGYVITGDQYNLYEKGDYNDVNVLIGTNSDEGAMFVRPVQPEEYKNSIEERFGPFADRILQLYPGNTEQETYTSAADIFRETAFAWPTWAWARLQSKTGHSNVYVYYFDQQQPASPFSPVKPRGAGHGAEINYVFGHLDQNPSNQYTDDDRKLSAIMSQYWVNFAKYGNPNGEGLPKWPLFEPGKPTVMYLDNTPKPGPVPHMDKLQLMEEYFEYRRDKNAADN